ncbi:FMN phosphatase YigB (HAD superfamily) [Tahibacter aquaticus]|uniref:FMN phosphatase YigB (HAD superfamily) n=1 Tax=Tahibacter aquaticus TaxID=520092 RepID=A0A4R6YM01_9GAMM|nr:HAD family hydrolase [Tahibacter aquaticus]TDR38357.1 FMN phosphatase YigB (HAD superfamily) [Tahibacter aquaticus]
MLIPAEVVFLLDVDNTLLDKDRFVADLTSQLDRAFGMQERERYWAIYADLRGKLGYADYLGALQTFRIGIETDPALLQMSKFLLDYCFSERLYSGALAAVEQLSRWGTTVILSDGDIVFQPRKIMRSGLWDATGGRVLVYRHKEQMLDVVQRLFPARHFVMIDDKPRLLAAMKPIMGDRLTTVFVQQGHYAAEAKSVAIDPTPDVTIEHIADLRRFAMSDFHATEASIVGARTQQFPGSTSAEQA